MGNNISERFLTIGIPTYNRGSKLDRLLGILYQQIDKEGLSNQVEILVSDNFSTDDTHLVLKKYSAIKDTFIYFIQESNVGFDQNVLSIYKQSRLKYVWLLADDDIPVPGALTKIISALKANLPEVLMFSFGQPPESKKGVYIFEEPVHLSSSISESIELLMRWPKISVYVLKCIKFTADEDTTIQRHTGDGWIHVILGLTIVDSTPNSTVAIISEILAHCDEDFDILAWHPDTVMKSHRIAFHPLVARVNRSAAKVLLEASYINSIQFCFAAKVGSLRVLDMKAYDSFIDNFPWKFAYLIKHPKSLAQLVLLKFKLTHLYSTRNSS